MKYLVPYVYGALTRNKTIIYKISFFITFVFLIFISILFYNNEFLYVLPRYVTALTALYCVYEIGYIFNDTYTVRFEEKPTHRLEEEERIKVEKQSNLMISFRVLVVAVCLSILKYLGTINLNVFIYMLVILNLAYAFHNSFRSRLNILTLLITNVLKYATIPVLFIPLEEYFLYFIVMVFIVPVIRTIEFAAKERFAIKVFTGYKLDLMRVIYYVALVVISIGLTMISSKFIFALVLATYMLIFRITSYIASKTEKVKSIRRKLNPSLRLHNGNE